MRKSFISILFAIVCSNTLFAAAAPQYFSFKSEYRRDAVDYEDSEKNFFRERARVYISPKSYAGVCGVYTVETRQKDYTYNCVLTDAVPHTELFFGNYYVHFGSGILAGKMMPYQADIFSKPALPHAKIFSPCDSGNSTFAYNGAAVSFSDSEDFLSWSLNGFYSMKKSFMENASDAGGSVGSTLGTLTSHSQSTWSFSQPAFVHQYGALAQLAVTEYFKFQLYSTASRAESAAQKEILFSYNGKLDPPAGIASHEGAGLYAAYRDDYVHLFFDNAVSKINWRKSDGGNYSDTGYTSLIGTGFHHPYLSFSGDMRFSTKKYFSPQASSSGSVSAKEGWSAVLSGRPLHNLVIGGAASSEVYQTPALYADEIIPRCRESIFTELTVSRAVFSAEGTRLGPDFTENDYEKLQIKSDIKIRCTKKVRAEARVLYQRKDASSPSWMYSAGVTVQFPVHITGSVLFGQSFCSAANRMYSPAGQLPGGSVRTSSFSDSENFAALNVSASYEHISIAVRVFHEFTFWQPERTRTEFSAGGSF